LGYAEDSSAPIDFGETQIPSTEDFDQAKAQRACARCRHTYEILDVTRKGATNLMGLPEQFYDDDSQAVAMVFA
jgi:hypothetical protein